MILFPAIDLLAGNCVRLAQGCFKRTSFYGIAPCAVAKQYERDGAQWLHLIDLDGAQRSNLAQYALIRQIIAHTNLAVQVGGGIRSADQIEQLLSAGAKRVVVSSAVIRDPMLGSEWLNTFGPERIVLALDFRSDKTGDCKLALQGWQKNAEFTVTEFLQKCTGIIHVLCTDIDRDGMQCGPNFNFYQNLKKLFPSLKIQASGGIATLADLKQLRQLNLAGCIIGKALYEKSFSLPEALQC